MNLAIEYLTRTKLSQRMLKLPCSLFIQNVFNQNGLVINVQSCYGQPEQLRVKHWYLDKVTKDRILPPLKEFVINRSDLFTDSFVIVDDYNILPYAPNPYPIQSKQSADEPYASRQEFQYHECLDQFFNTSINETRRKDWLWRNFVYGFFNETINNSDFAMMSPDSQRNAVQTLCPIPWKGWCMWIEQMICNNKSSVATELAFASAYQDKLKTNEKYQQLITPQLIQPIKPKTIAWKFIDDNTLTLWDTVSFNYDGE